MKAKQVTRGIIKCATFGINFVHYVFLDEALRNTHFTWGKPIPPTESTMEDDEELDDAELNLDKVEEEMAAVRELYVSGYITKGIYISETDRLYSKAKIFGL